MTTRRKRAALVLIHALALELFFTPALPAGDFFLFAPFQRKKPEVPEVKHDPVERLAQEIDWLESHLETYGTIVPKHPNVWGEARLTKHRQEFEKQMAAQVSLFAPTINANLSMRDQSFLATAFTLGAAASGTAPNPLGTGVANQVTIFDLVKEGETTTKEIIRPTQFTDRLPIAQAFDPGKDGQQIRKVSLEPVINLQQQARYINFLHELRRINEGDDTADSPGYALNLVRIPVSVLPGKKTREGYGAEITITAQPYLSDELLPMTMRNLVVEDCVDQLAPTITKVLHDNWNKPEVWEEVKKALVHHAWSSSRSDKIRAQAKNLELKPLHFDGAPELDEKSRTFGIERAGALMKLDKLMPSVMHAARSPRSRRSSLAISPAQMIDVFGIHGHVLSPVIYEAYKSLKLRPATFNYVLYGDVQAFLRTELVSAYDFLSRDVAQQLLWQGHCSQALVEAIRGWQNGRRAEPGQIAKLRKAFFDAIDNLPPPYNEAKTSIAASLAWAIIVESALLNDRLIEDMRETAAAKGCTCLNGAPGWPPFFGPNPPPDARAAFNEYVRCRWPIHVFALDPVTDDQNVGDFASVRREMQLAVAVAFASGNINGNAAMNFMRRIERDVETISLNRTAIGFSHGADTFGWRFYPRVQTPEIKSTLGAVKESLMGGPSKDQIMREWKLEAGMRECVAIMLMPSFVPYAVFESRANWFNLVNPAHKELALHDAMKISKIHQSVHKSLQRVGDCGLYRPGDVQLMRRAIDQIDRKLPMQAMTVQIPYENTLGGFEMFSSGVTDLAPDLLGWYGEPGVRVAERGAQVASFGFPPGCSCGFVPVGGTEKTLADRTTTDKATNADKSSTEKVFTEKLSTERASPATPPPPGQCDGTCHGTTIFLIGDNFSVHETTVIAGGRCVPFELMSRQVMRVTIPENVSTFEDQQDPTKREYVDVHVATPYGVSGHLAIPVVERPAAKPAPAPAAARPRLSWVSPLGLKPEDLHGQFVEVKGNRKGQKLAILDCRQIHDYLRFQYSISPNVNVQPTGRIRVKLTVKFADGTADELTSSQSIGVNDLSIGFGRPNTAAPKEPILRDLIQDNVVYPAEAAAKIKEVLVTGEVVSDTKVLDILDNPFRIAVHQPAAKDALPGPWPSSKEGATPIGLPLLPNLGQWNLFDAGRSFVLARKRSNSRPWMAPQGPGKPPQRPWGEEIEVTREPADSVARR